MSKKEVFIDDSDEIKEQEKLYKEYVKIIHEVTNRVLKEKRDEIEKLK